MPAPLTAEMIEEFRRLLAEGKLPMIVGRLVCSKREDGTANIYATSLGPMRKCVPFAETYAEFGPLIVAAVNHAPAILSLATRAAELERLREAVARMGRAMLDAGPADDIGPPPEVTSEYYAANDAVHQLALELANLTTST